MSGRSPDPALRALISSGYRPNCLPRVYPRKYKKENQTDMKKTLSVIMALLLALLIFATSCAEAGENDQTSAPAASSGPADTTEQPVETEPQFQIKQYDGAVFTVYMRNENAGSYPGRYIDTEDVSETISSAVFSRNSIVEEEFKIDIQTKQVSDPYKTVVTDIAGGDVDYDLLLDRRVYLASLAKQGYLHNLNDMGWDFTKSWWDQKSAEQYEINGKLYLVSNDISVANLSGARFFYFNKKMVEDRRLYDPYELVNSNDWVLDKFLEMVSGVENTEPEGTLGVYGLLMETGSSNGNYIHLLTGCGVRQTVWEDGQLVTALETDAEKIQTIFDKIKPVFDNPALTLTYDKAEKIDSSGTYPNKYDRGRSRFAQGHFLFVQNGMGVAAQFAEMEGDGYGVVPNPKYNSDQPEYMHKIDKYSLIWAVPEATSYIDFERVALVTDYWAYQSSKTVMPAFYEITIKTKRVSDPVAPQMLDIVKDTICYEIADLFGIDVAGAFEEAYTGGSVTRVAQSKVKVMNKTIESLLSEFGNR